jgi:hypothetical protein
VPPPSRAKQAQQSQISRIAMGDIELTIFRQLPEPIRLGWIPKTEPAGCIHASAAHVGWNVIVPCARPCMRKWTHGMNPNYRAGQGRRSKRYGAGSVSWSR